MKKLKFYLAAFSITVFAFMVGCNNDTGSDVTTDLLKVTVNEGTSSTYKQGTTVVYNWSVVSGEKMNSLVITPSKGSAETKNLGNNVGSLSGSYTYPISATETQGTVITIKFVATDAKTAFTETKSFIIVANSPLMTVTNSGVIYHILGAKQGAWDLMTNAGVPEGGGASRYLGSNKDMINVENSTVGLFEKKWVAGNTTRFVKVTGFDYANATVDGAKDAYSKGTEIGEGGSTFATLKSPVSCGISDIFIAKLRGAENYAVIKIEEILDDGAVSNDDYIKFSYKKASTAKAGGKTLMVNF
jgi:hypothetical protein